MNKKIIILLLFCFSFTSLFSSRYYICLGSFLDKENSSELKSRLSSAGIDTIFEDVSINGRSYQRVLIAKPLSDLSTANVEIKNLYKNRIIIAEGIKDIWVRHGEIASNYASTDFSDDSENEENSVSNYSPEKNNLETRTDNASTSSDETKVLNEEGYTNCVFAAVPIEKGKESQYELKTVFTKPESVYARAYFSEKIGEIKAENFWHEIWIDGRFAMKTTFKEPPDADWDQIQIWITEDEYKTQMDNLTSGEHEIIIWVMKNVYNGEKAVAEENAAGEIVAYMKEIWIPTRLSKGKFKYIVP